MNGESIPDVHEMYFEDDMDNIVINFCNRLNKQYEILNLKINTINIFII